MKILSLLLVLTTVYTYAEEKEIKVCDFAPINTLNIPDSLELASGIDKKDYDIAIDRIETLYTKIVASKGGKLQINRMWTTPEVNSNATRKGNTYIINAYGGLARYSLMTFDGEMMVLCHEMGHHIGNFPFYPYSIKATWASNEGQSDYFATMKCFRRLIENDDNEAIIGSMSIPPEVNKSCKLAFKTAKEIAICKRSSMTGKTLANVLYQLGRQSAHISEPSTPPDFGTPSTIQVSTTNDEHPVSQCRLDTYFNGAICGVSQMIEFGINEGATGACSQEKNDTYGFRPRCWYKPGSVEYSKKSSTTIVPHVISFKDKR